MKGKKEITARTKKLKPFPMFPENKVQFLLLTSWVTYTRFAINAYELSKVINIK